MDVEAPQTEQMIEAVANWSDGRGPLHRRLAAALREAIERGDIAPGTRLPAERALAQALAISRSTVVAAYASLRQESWLVSRQGSGTFVPRREEAPPAAREPDVLRKVRRTPVFRGLIEGPGRTIEFLGAHLPACDALTPELFASCAAELPDLVRGPGYLPLGLPALRRAIAKHLTGWGLATREEEVLVTNGAQQAISLAASLFLQPDEAVVMENPTYITAIDVFNAQGARIVPVGSGADGVRVDELEDAIERTAPRLVYLLPTFQNPTGSVMPERARRQIARLAEEQDVPVVEDLTLADLSLGDEPPPPIAAFTKTGMVFTIGSFSKLFWGGLRLGWIRGPENQILRLARLRILADLGSSLLSQVVAVRLLEEVESVKEKRRHQARSCLANLTGLLGSHLPGWTFTKPLGGLSLWVRLPYGDAGELAQVALRHGVSLVPGPVASPDGRFTDHLRIPFVLPPDQMEEGIGRLARAFQAYAPAAERRRATLDVIV